MDRLELLNKLLTVQPALADNNIIPILTHVWFRGKYLMGYNDTIAISVPCKTEFTGAVPGSTLINFLKNSRAKDVEFKATDTELQVKAGGSRWKLPLLPSDAFVFDMPVMPSVPTFRVGGKALLDSIKNCIRSIIKDESIPEQVGVTLIPDEGHTNFYSSDGATLSHSSITMPTGLEERAIISAPFCRQLLKLASKSKSWNLHITNEYSLFASVEGETLFGKLVHSKKPVDFAEIMRANFNPRDAKRAVDIPSQLGLILSRAAIVNDSKLTRASSVMTVTEGRFKLVSKSERGEVVDTMRLDDHSDTRMLVEPKLLQAGFGDFDKILITEKCAVMTKDNHLYMVAANGE